MPTGYTDKISKGISFETFVMICARAFGACIEMHDDSIDATIPEEFKPSKYYTDKIAEAQRELKLLEEVTDDGAEWRATVEYNQNVAQRKESLKKNVELLRKYNDMLLKVMEWEPPTPDHVGLKNFMIEQITESIKYDSMIEFYNENPIIKLSGKEWLDREIETVKKSIEYYNKENTKEIERTNERNAWIKALRESLKTT